MALHDGLAIRGLSKRFGSIQAVDGLDLDVPPGELIGFLGPNGAGKTTTMRGIMDMVKLDAGQITWNGRPLAESDVSIGYMPQERGLYAKMRAKDQVVYFAQLAGLDRSTAERQADYWLDRVGLTDRSNAYVQELSGGNQQRVQLAVSLAHNPDLLVLDEPFAGLDPIAAETMRSIIADSAADGASVLFSSHQLDLVENLCEDVVIVTGGRRVAAGSVSDLRSAAPTRQLNVRWETPTTGWTPLEGTIEAHDETSASAVIPAESDIGAQIAHAAAAGTVAAVSVEPPSLADIFAQYTSEDTGGEDNDDEVAS